MRIYLLGVFVFVFVLLDAKMVFAGVDSSFDIGIPVKYVEGCELDLDRDSKQDMALLLENAKHTMLIVLLNRGDEYESKTLFKAEPGYLRLSCMRGGALQESQAVGGELKTITIDGGFLLLSQPESSKVAFYWNDGRFYKLWVSD